MHLAQVRKLFLCFGQIVLLAMVRRERFISRNHVLLLKRTPVYQTRSRSNPVLEFAQSVVVHASASLKPVQQFGLLNGIWIDSVGIVHCQHSYSLPQAIAAGKCLSPPHRGESTSAGSPWLPTLTFQVERGTYSPPNPPLVKHRERNQVFVLIPLQILTMKKV